MLSFQEISLLLMVLPPNFDVLMVFVLYAKLKANGVSGCFTLTT